VGVWGDRKGGTRQKGSGGGDFVGNCEEIEAWIPIETSKKNVQEGEINARNLWRGGKNPKKENLERKRWGECIRVKKKKARGARAAATL